jgi:hypothetical protein
MKRHFQILSVAMFCFISSEGFSQRIVTCGFQLNPGINSVSVKTPEGLTGFSLKGGFGINCGVNGAYYLKKNIALFTGLQLYGYNFEHSGSGYYASYNTQDSEGKNYERRIWGKDISEKTSLNLLHIPLCFMWDHKINANFHVFAIAGPSLVIPVNNHTQASGTFTYKGYYADGDYILADIPIYGYNSEVPVDVDDKINTRLISVHGMLSVGCFFYMNRYWRFGPAISFVRSFSSISGDSSNDFSFSKEVGSFYSILGNKGSSLNNFSFGLTIQKILMF